MSVYYGNAYADDLQAAWLESKKVVDPQKLVFLTSQAGLVAQVIATSFLKSLILEAAGYANKLPSACEMLRTDFVRLNLADRAQVTVAGYPLQVMVIGNDPVDPCVQLTLQMFS